MKVNYFKRSILHYLSLNEYHALVENIFQYLGRVDFEDAVVLDLLVNAEKHKEPLLQVVERRRFHKNSTIISDKADERHRLLRSFCDSAKAGENSEKPEKRAAAAVLKSFIRKEKTAFSRRRINLQTILVARLAYERKVSTELAEAMVTLDVDGLVDEVVTLSNEMSLLRESRFTDRNKLKQLAEERRRDSCEDLMMLLTTFESKANLDCYEQEMFQRICLDIQSMFVEAKVASMQRKAASKDEDNDVEASGADQNGNQDGKNSDGDNKEGQSNSESKES